MRIRPFPSPINAPADAGIRGRSKSGTAPSSPISAFRGARRSVDVHHLRSPSPRLYRAAHAPGPGEGPGPASHRYRWHRVNAKVGLTITLLVGTMLCGYIFAAIAADKRSEATYADAVLHETMEIPETSRGTGQGHRQDPRLVGRAHARGRHAAVRTDRTAGHAAVRPLTSIWENRAAPPTPGPCCRNGRGGR